MSNIRHGYPNNPQIMPFPGAPGKRMSRAESLRRWALEAIDAPGAWLIPTKGPEQIICIIDTGFTPEHQDLRPTGSAAEIALDNSGDDNGHGTAVGGIIAAAHDTGHGRAGACRGAKILAYKVHSVWTDYIGSTLPHIGVAFDQMAERIGKAIRMINHENEKEFRYKILNISKSGPSLSDETSSRITEKYLKAAVEIFLAQGGLLVVGGPNEANAMPVDCFPAAIKSLSSYPENILIIGSINYLARPWDMEIDLLYKGQDTVDLYAPGGMQEVLGHKSLFDYTHKAGNSLALPHVAGIAAFLLRINPDLTGKDLARIILETAENKSSVADKPKYLLNAFAAALAVHNNIFPDRKLAGYRVIINTDFSMGTLEVNGEPVYINVNESHGLCRFVAPLDQDIHVRLFKHPDLDNGKLRRCYWEGGFQGLLQKVQSGSNGSAWFHHSVEALRTVRLQGVASYIYYPGGKELVKLSNVSLRNLKTGVSFRGKTDALGYCVIPFGDPGKHTLSVEDDRYTYEAELMLEVNMIHEDNILLGEAVSKATWVRTFAGDVLFKGDAKLFSPSSKLSYEELKNIVIYPGDLYRGDLYDATGTITLNINNKDLDKETAVYKILIDHDDFVAQMVDEEGIDWVTDDGMPDLSSLKYRVFSENICLLQDNYSEAIKTRLDDWISENGHWHEGYDLIDREMFVDIPPGAIVASGNEDVVLSLPILIRQLLKCRFEQVAYDQRRLPLYIDISVIWSLDYTAVYGEGIEIVAKLFNGRIHPAMIPYKVEHLPKETNKWRVIAGPAYGLLEFIAHPKNPYKIEVETISYPGTTISALIQKPENNSVIPAEYRELWVISSQGEINRIDLRDF